MALAAVGVAAVSAGLVAVTAGPAGTTPAGTVLSLTLTEWKLSPQHLSVRPGRVSFVVRNDGTMTHEFVVLRSDRHHHSLKVQGGRAVEKGLLGEIPIIAAGASKRLTLKLPAGRYVLLCNLFGHYQAGQYAALRIR